MGIRNSDLLVTSTFLTNEDGYPTGGTTSMSVYGPEEDGSGGVVKDAIRIDWQAGIIPEGGFQNGAFIEDVIEAALQRLRFLNTGPGRCRENSLAITKLEEAMQWLDWRTRQRIQQGVENTYQPHEDGGL